MSDKIAIIGYACRLPGQVSTPEDLWTLCTRNRNGWTEIPKDRFSTDALHHPNPSKPGTFNSKGCYSLSFDDISRFDANFFNLSASEAISLDPQQRLMLECTFEAMEGAGITMDQFAGRNVGVYAGANFSDYELMNCRDIETVPMHQATGGHHAMQSNRISYSFDLRGPSITFNTACSSSLTALHHAVQSLKRNECSEAIVAGCRLNILPDYFVSMSMSQLLSDHGRAHAFDSRADSGFARGEGAAVLILKPLDAALRDKDSIRAVICASGMNQDGKTHGITNPSGNAQRDLVRQVYRDAGLDPLKVGYAEMHGTGTLVGDPIEAAAIHQSLALGRSPADPLYIGSVKTNVGHTEGASGVVSLIKAAMMLEKELCLPHADFKEAHPAIPLEKWNMKVLTTTMPWPRSKKYVSVSNYGFGGTNVHAVLEMPPLEARMKPEVDGADVHDPTMKLYLISANDKESLQARVKDLGIYFERRPEVFEKMHSSNVAYTLSCRRSHLSYRLAIPASSLNELSMKLARTYLQATWVTGAPTISFVFNGQGAQWARMGAALLPQYPVFASAIHNADRCLTALGADFSLLAELTKDAMNSCIDCAYISQPACTALQIALVDLFRSWGIVPSSVVGQSSGEIAAAYAVGAFDADTAMALAYHRGTLTTKLKNLFPDLKGGMIAIGADREEVELKLEKITAGYTTIACINSPTSVTVAGDHAAILELHEVLDREGIFNRRLAVDVAYHSEHMARVSDLYLDSISDLLPAPSLNATFYSSVYGREITASDLRPEYWVKNLVSPVLFLDAMNAMCSSEAKPDLLIEIGPHHALKGPIQETLKKLGAFAAKISYSASLTRNTDTTESMLEAAGAAYVKGTAIDMINVNYPTTKACFNTLLTDLPRYSWQHGTQYWHESRITQKHVKRGGKRNDVLGVLANYSNDLEPTWRNILRLDDVPWLRQHKMQGMPVFPMAGYLAMAIEAAQQHALTRDATFDAFELREVVAPAALVLTDGVDTETTLTLRRYNDASRGDSDVWDEFKICSWENARGWIEHCRGLVRVTNSQQGKSPSIGTKIAAQEAAICQAAHDVEMHATRLVDEDYMNAQLDNAGAGFGPLFQGLKNCYTDETHSRGDAYVSDTAKVMPKEFETPLVIHPSFLDIIFHLTWPLLGAAAENYKTLYMPTLVRSAKIDRNLSVEPGDYMNVWCTGDPNLENPKPTTFEICATKPGNLGKPVVHIEGFVMSPIRDTVASDKHKERKICYKLISQPFKPGLAMTEEDFNGHGELDPGSKDDKQAGELQQMVQERRVDSGFCSPKHNVGADVVIVEFGSPSRLAVKLAGAINAATGLLPPIIKLGESGYDQKKVVLLEMTDKNLRNIDAAEFTSLQSVLTSAARLVWVYNKDVLESAMSVGLVRTIRCENLSYTATLGIEDVEIFSISPCGSIMQVLDALWFIEPTKPVQDQEFISNGGELFVQRLVEDESMNAFISNETSNSLVIAKQLFKQAGRRLKLQIREYGALDSIHWVDEISSSLGGDEVEIEVKATGVNFKDIIISMGQISQPYIGGECSGIVAAVGKNVSHISVGQRVMAQTTGAYSTYARAVSTSVSPMPPNMSFEKAATIPVVFCTAYYGLFHLGRLTADDKILIHAAAGGVGQAAIILSKMAGAEIYATVGSPEKKAFLVETYGLEEDKIFYSRDASFAQDLKLATQNSGVDVVLNSLAGELLRESWECLAPFGRFIEIGKADITRNSHLDMQKFEYNCTFASVDLTRVAAQKPKLMRQLLDEICGLLSKGAIRPILPIKTYSIAETESAFRALQTGKSTGKLVVVPYENDQVFATTPRLSSHLFRPDGTYLLIGGTGGLGRSMATYMSSKGARTIVLVSRNATLTPQLQSLTSLLSASGTTLLLKPCDVSSLPSLSTLLTSLSPLPPIRGVIHGAMVLRDMLFENMNLAAFHAVTQCKVEGCLNLHTALASCPLDFFIALSSVSGVAGNLGQAAYSAANVFLDNLMAFRRSLALPGTSISLAAVSNAGYFADVGAARRDEMLAHIGDGTITDVEVNALLAAAVTGRIDASAGGQAVTGFHDPAETAFWLDDAKFKGIKEGVMARSETGAAVNPGVVVPLVKVLKAATSGRDATMKLCDALTKKIAAVLIIDEEAIEYSHTLKSLGLDSLVAIELRTWIARETEVNMQVLELISSGSIMNLAERIVKKMGVAGAT